MNEVNYSYSFRLGNSKIEVDIGYNFSANEDVGEEKESSSHYHAKHELFFVKNDPVQIQDSNGQKEYHNCFVFIPSFHVHNTVKPRAYRILFSTERVGHGVCDFSSFLENYFSGNSIKSFSTDKNVTLYFEDLKTLLTDNSELGRDGAVCALKLIFYSIYRSLSNRRRETRKTKESYLITIENIINKYSLDPTKKVDLECVANELHLGKKQTSRIIYKFFGRSLSELILERRLTIASKLLASTSKSISEIAQETNFHSENYFFLTFKRHFGITPLAYRKRSGNVVI
jgi:AraC-like DNA-binding protein